MNLIIRTISIGLSGMLAMPALATTPTPISISLKPNLCEYGKDVAALFSQINKAMEKELEAVEAKRYANDEAKQSAMTAVSEKGHFLKVNRSFKGLTLTTVATHYESSSLYFANPAAQVKSVFKSLGYKVSAEGYVEGKEEGGATTSIEPSGPDERVHGKSVLICGI